MFYFDNMDEILFHYLKKLLQQDSIVSPRDQTTKELLGVGFRLKNPRFRIINNEARNWNFRLAAGEFLWHLNASDDVSFISHYAPVWKKFSDDQGKIRGSCYGKKMFANGQWSKLIKLLKSDLQSRRAVISFYDSLSEENITGNDVACITNIQFLVRDGKLNCITNMRSNDIIWGLCYDLFLATLFQEILSLELDLKLGWYQHNANSLHLYEHHYDKAQKILKDGFPNTVMPMSKISNKDQINKLLEFENELRIYNSINYDILNSLNGGIKEMAEFLISKSALDQNATS